MPKSVIVKSFPAPGLRLSPSPAPGTQNNVEAEAEDPLFITDNVLLVEHSATSETYLYSAQFSV